MEKKLGAEQTLEIDFEDGNLVILIKQAGTDGGVEIKGYISADRLIDKLAEKIPGSVDDAIFGYLKVALRAQEKKV